MTDLKEQAQRLIDGSYLYAHHAPAIAQAYLDQCGEIERLREALERLLHFARTKAHDDYLNADLKAAKKAARKALGDIDV